MIDPLASSDSRSLAGTIAACAAPGRADAGPSLPSDPVTLAWFAGAVVAASVVVVLVLLPKILAGLPTDYLDAARPVARARRSLRSAPLVLARNLLGWVFLAVGLVLIPLPGPGLLIVFTGLLLVDLPGKRRMVRAALARPSLLGLVNRIRARQGQPPLL